VNATTNPETCARALSDGPPYGSSAVAGRVGAGNGQNTLASRSTRSWHHGRACMSDNIRALWSEGGYTAREIAHKLGIKVLTVENLRRGDRAKQDRIAARDAGPVEPPSLGPPETIDINSAVAWADRHGVARNIAAINAERAGLGLTAWRIGRSE